MGGGGGTGARGGDGAARSVGAPAAASGVEGVRVPAGGEKPLALVALLSRALSGDEAGGFFRLPARAAPKPPSARAAGGLRPHRRAGGGGRAGGEREVRGARPDRDGGPRPGLRRS